MSTLGLLFKRSVLTAVLAQGIVACLCIATAAAINVPAPPDAQLSMSRVFASPANEDALHFTIPVQAANLVSQSVFGLSAPAQLSAQNTPARKPELFGQVLDASYVPYAQPGLKVDQSATVAGVHFRLFGGQQSLAFENFGRGFAPTAFGSSNPGSAPALFAFYNFPRLSQFPENANALNPPGEVPLPNNAAQPLANLSFPGLDLVRPQPATAFNGLLSNSRGATLQFRFPLVFSGVKANVRLNGAALREVQPDSLATQIFGPAFAPSVGRKYSSLGGGMTLALPLFDRKAMVSLDGLYESIKRNDKTSLLYAANASYLANNPNAMPYNLAGGTSLDSLSVPSALIFYPNYADVKRFTSAASLAVPVGKRLTVNGGFSEQRYNGEALNTLTQDLSQGTRSISGGLVYNIPKTNSSIDLIFNRYQYFDDVVPASNRTENRQNIYFSVKF